MARSTFSSIGFLNYFEWPFKVGIVGLDNLIHILHAPVRKLIGVPI